MKVIIFFLLQIYCISLFASDRLADEMNQIEIKVQLAEMRARDQTIRFELQRLLEQGYSFEYLKNSTSIICYMEKIDRANLKKLKQIIKSNGWPTISHFGAVADNDAWLVVQHSDHDPSFQETLLRYLNAAAKAHDTNLQHVAFLADRISVHKQIPQRYGTQGRCIGKHRWQAFPIEKTSELNIRRKNIGLVPMAEYQKMMSQICQTGY